MSIAGLLDMMARWQDTLTCPGKSADGSWLIRRFPLDRENTARENAREISKSGVILICLVMTFASPAHAQTQMETHGAQSPAISTTTGNVAIKYGFTAEQVQDLIKAARAGDEDKIASLSSKLDVTQGAAVTMLRIIGQQDVPFEKLPQKLAEVAEQYKSAMERLAALDPQDPMTRDLVARADAAFKAGRLDEADRLVGQAENAEVVAARQAQKVARQAQAAADQRLLRAAADREVRGNIAMTRLQYLDAAQHFEEAVNLVPAGHPDEKGRFLLAKAEALFVQGDERGDNVALVNSMSAYKLALGEYARDRTPVWWAMTQNGLGNALERLGERESGTKRLEEAIAAYRAVLEALGAYYAALEEDARDRVSWIDWAMTQMNLGAALQTLGDREGGTERLKEAVAAYRAALDEYTRDRAPLQWALTQMNLGNALRTLGEREDNVVRLEEAVAAYRGALEECTRERVPLDWAATQNNLGTVLWTLGKGETTTTRLEQAVAGFRAALEEYTRDRAPLHWAMTQNNLGMALKTLGERESGTARLEEAVGAYRAALEEYSPDRVPLQWARTQMNLGNALLRLGEQGDGTTRLEQAVAVYRKALELDPMPIDQANIGFNMGIALTDLGRRTHSTDSLKEALLWFRKACEVFREAGMMQLSMPCHSAITPLRHELEPGAPSTSEPAKPAG